MQWVLTWTLNIWMYLTALALGLAFKIWSKTHGLQSVWGSRESTSGFHIIKKWAVLLQGPLFCLSLVERVLPGKDQWAALEDAVCIHKLTKNIQGQLLNALIIVQTCSFVVYRAVDSPLEKQRAKGMCREAAHECRWAGSSFPPRHPGEANGLILRYLTYLGIDLASGKACVLSLIQMMQDVIFALGGQVGKALDPKELRGIPRNEPRYNLP